MGLVSGTYISQLIRAYKYYIIDRQWYQFIVISIESESSEHPLAFIQSFPSHGNDCRNVWRNLCQLAVSVVAQQIRPSLGVCIVIAIQCISDSLQLSHIVDAYELFQ